MLQENNGTIWNTLEPLNSGTFTMDMDSEGEVLTKKTLDYLDNDIDPLDMTGRS